MGKYKDEYEQLIDAVKKANNDLKKKVNDLYANILTIMEIFVFIFSLITINFANLSTANMTKSFIIPMNLSLGIAIALFIGLILLFLNKASNKWFLGLYIGIMEVLIVLLVVMI